MTSSHITFKCVSSINVNLLRLRCPKCIPTDNSAQVSDVQYHFCRPLPRWKPHPSISSPQHDNTLICFCPLRWANSGTAAVGLWVAKMRDAKRHVTVR